MNQEFEIVHNDDDTYELFLHDESQGLINSIQTEHVHFRFTTDKTSAQQESKAAQRALRKGM